MLYRNRWRTVRDNFVWSLNAFYRSPEFINAITTHLKTEYDATSTSIDLTQLYFVTVTLNDSNGFGRLTTAEINAAWRAFDRFYRHLCSKVLGKKFHKPHKRPLQPMAYAFLDLPGPNGSGRNERRISARLPKTNGRPEPRISSSRSRKAE